MTNAVQLDERLNARNLRFSAGRIFFLLTVVLIFDRSGVRAQCPATGETKVMKPSQGTGYYFYKFLGDSSFRYFLDGSTFSFNEKDDPRKTLIFIDKFAYESILIEKNDLAKYVTSSKPEDILRAQAQHQQTYFKSIVPQMVITDYGPSARKNPDGSDDRLFYLWKKENPKGSTDATQYLVSTLVPDGVVVLSLMPSKGPVSEDEFFAQIQKYTSHFDLVSSELCARVVSAPVH
jgi:hypothetical protein